MLVYYGVYVCVLEREREREREREGGLGGVSEKKKLEGKITLQKLGSNFTCERKNIFLWFLPGPAGFISLLKWRFIYNLEFIPRQIELARVRSSHLFPLSYNSVTLVSYTRKTSIIPVKMKVLRPQMSVAVLMTIVLLSKYIPWVKAQIIWFKLGYE